MESQRRGGADDTGNLLWGEQMRNGFAYRQRLPICAPQIRGAKHDTVSLFENGNGFRFAEPVLSIHARPIGV